MELVVFINGVYHSLFFVTDLETFLPSFCTNNGLEVSEVSLFHNLTIEQQNQIQSLLSETSTLKIHQGKVQVIERIEDTDTIKIEIQLQPV
jgi:hypothetical protein